VRDCDSDADADADAGARAGVVRVDVIQDNDYDVCNVFWLHEDAAILLEQNS